MIRTILIGAGTIFALLLAVILFRTFTYGGAPQDIREIVLPAAPEFDSDVAAQHLGEAIRFQTVTVAPGDPRVGQEGPWIDLQAWMETTYPAFHAAAQKETVSGGYTLLFTWQGSEVSKLKP